LEEQKKKELKITFQQNSEQENSRSFLNSYYETFKRWRKMWDSSTDGFLFGEGVKTRIKEKLLSEFNLTLLLGFQMEFLAVHRY
jgi:hypothetical protein